MFDIGFWELCLIGLVALIVIGPERLPTAARVAGLWFGKVNRMVSSVKQEIRDELRAEELRQQLAEKSGVDEVRGAIDETRKSLSNLDSAEDKREVTAEKSISQQDQSKAKATDSISNTTVSEDTPHKDESKS